MICQLNPPGLHRLDNILEGLWSHIVTDNVDLAPDLPKGIIRHADPARFGDALKAGSNVDAISEDVVVIDDDVPDVDAYPQLDPRILRHIGVLFGHGALDFNGTTDRIHGAGELNQQAVAGGFDDATSMGGY